MISEFHNPIFVRNETSDQVEIAGEASDRRQITIGGRARRPRVSRQFPTLLTNSQWKGYQAIVDRYTARMMTPLAIAVLSCLTCPTASAQDSVDLSLDAIYIADIFHNEGGIEDGTVYLDNLGLSATAEFDNGLEVHISTLYNNGSSLSELTGDTMVVSNIETGVEAFRLYEAWVAGNLSASSSYKIGLFDLNSEFDVLDISGLFIGSAHGIGMDIAQTGDNGPSIFPTPGLALRLQHELNENTTLRGAIIEGTPGNPDRPKRTTIRLGGDEGALIIGEYERRSERSKILAGAWAYTEELPTWDGRKEETNYGLYLRGETVFFDSNGASLTGFARLGLANGEVNEFSEFASLGFNYGLASGHQAGLGFAYSVASDDRLEPTDSGEMALELTYAVPLNEYLTFQPNVQYVASPSADPGIDDALVFGIRFIGQLGY